MNSWSHILSPGIMRSCTVRSGNCGFIGVSTLQFIKPRILLHIYVCSSANLPSAQWSRTNFADQRLLQVKLGLWPNFAPRKSDYGKYLALSSWLAIESLSFNNFHPCFANIATLNAYKSRNPIPPFSLRMQSLSQLIQFIPRTSFLFESHQKELTIFLISSGREIGSKKQFTQYEGIDWTTALSIPLFQL